MKNSISVIVVITLCCFGYHQKLGAQDRQIVVPDRATVSDEPLSTLESNPSVFRMVNDQSDIRWERIQGDDADLYELQVDESDNSFTLRDMSLDFSDPYQIHWQGYLSDEPVEGVLVFVPSQKDGYVTIEFMGDIHLVFEVPRHEIESKTFGGITLISTPATLLQKGPVQITPRPGIGLSKCKCCGVSPTGSCTQNQCDTAEECTGGICKNVLGMSQTQ